MRTLTLALLVALSLAQSGCATIFTGSGKQIRFESAPEGANVYNDGGTFTRDGEAVPSDNPDGGDDGGLIPGIPGLPEIPGLPDLPLP